MSRSASVGVEAFAGEGPLHALARNAAATANAMMMRYFICRWSLCRFAPDAFRERHIRRGRAPPRRRFQEECRSGTVGGGAGEQSSFRKASTRLAADPSRESAPDRPPP